MAGLVVQPSEVGGLVADELEVQLLKSAVDILVNHGAAEPRECAAPCEASGVEV